MNEFRCKRNLVGSSSRVKSADLNFYILPSSKSAAVKKMNPNVTTLIFSPALTVYKPCNLGHIVSPENGFVTYKTFKTILPPA